MKLFDVNEVAKWTKRDRLEWAAYNLRAEHVGSEEDAAHYNLRTFGAPMIAAALATLSHDLYPPHMSYARSYQMAVAYLEDLEAQTQRPTVLATVRALAA